MEKEVRGSAGGLQEDELKHLKELYMAKVSQVSQEVLRR